MQESDEQRRTGRPSLLSEGPPPGDDQGILNKLDGRAGPAKGAHAPRKAAGKAGIVAGLVAVVALGGSALVWSGMDDGGSPGTPAAVPAPPLAAAVSPVVEPAVSAPAPEPEVSAATILDNVPDAAAPVAAAAAVAGTAALLADGKRPASTTSATPAVPGEKDELAAFLDKAEADKGKHTPQKAAVKKKSEPVKVARKDKASTRNKKTAVAAAPKKKPAAKSETPMDSDVALLAALLAHSKATAAPGSKTATDYKRCGERGTTADADKCRERVCEGSKAKAECKTLKVAEAAG